MQLFRIKRIVKLAWAASWAFIGCLAITPLLAQPQASSTTEDGIALAIVYDTSGSMGQAVRDANGTSSPKYVIASRALNSIVNRLETVAAPSSGRPPRRIDAALIVFQGEHGATAVKFGKFDAQALRRWLKSFSKPEGSTPLGEAVRLAGETVLASNLNRKHVLVITDGENTRGPDPASIMPRLIESAKGKNTSVGFHFVAFDVDANAFARVKKLGSTVVGAADEKQLNAQLEFILAEKILLEEEESPRAGEKKK